MYEQESETDVKIYLYLIQTLTDLSEKSCERWSCRRDFLKETFHFLIMPPPQMAMLELEPDTQELQSDD